MSSFDQTYRASEVISVLQKLILEHGDLPVLVADADTGWLLEAGIAYQPTDGYPERIEICSDYSGRPYGAKPLQK